MAKTNMNSSYKKEADMGGGRCGTQEGAVVGVAI